MSPFCSLSKAGRGGRGRTGSTALSSSLIHCFWVIQPTPPCLCCFSTIRLCSSVVPPLCTPPLFWSLIISLSTQSLLLCKSVQCPTLLCSVSFPVRLFNNYSQYQALLPEMYTYFRLYLRYFIVIFVRKKKTGLNLLSPQIDESTPRAEHNPVREIGQWFSCWLCSRAPCHRGPTGSQLILDTRRHCGHTGRAHIPHDLHCPDYIRLFCVDGSPHHMSPGEQTKAVLNYHQFKCL